MAVLFPSIERIDKETTIPLQSDVFSLKLHDEHQLFTGTRNGSIKLFDLRVDTKQQRPRDLLGTRHGKLQSIVIPWMLSTAGIYLWLVRIINSIVSICGI